MRSLNKQFVMIVLLSSLPLLLTINGSLNKQFLLIVLLSPSPLLLTINRIPEQTVPNDLILAVGQRFQDSSV
jgi:tRNA uridine 5-carbamoylmethylation protein Kti12